MTKIVTIHTDEIEYSVSNRRNWTFGLIQPNFGNLSDTAKNKLMTIQKKNLTTTMSIIISFEVSGPR